jgi:DNA-binding CsgD family transcriptional regulator
MKGLVNQKELNTIGSADWTLRRRRPALIVIDDRFNIIGAEASAVDLLAQSLGIELQLDQPLPDALREPLARNMEFLESGSRATVPIGGLLLHLMSLDGNVVACYGVLVEPKAEREYLKRATERFALSKREAEVLSLIVGGQRGNEIAHELHITPATVNDHFKSLLRKTGARSRSEMLVNVLGK